MKVRLEVTNGPHFGQVFHFQDHQTFIVGRSSQVQFSVPDDEFLSRNHFLIEFNPPSCLLRDLGSTNGTKVNGVRVQGQTLLGDGDTIVAGGSAFLIHIERTDSVLLSEVTCIVCGTHMPENIAVHASPGDESIEWLCPACQKRKRLYPHAPKGYFFNRRLGGGGMGEVYHATRLTDRCAVAIKMMIRSSAASERYRAYFRRELEILKVLRHPNIVAFHDVEEIDGQYYLIMEYVDGENALEWLARIGPGQTPISGVIWVGIRLLEALGHAHGKGYVHRDIKPSNLLLFGPDHEPGLKLSDFGLAKSFRDNAGFAGLTHAGDIGGSVGFISPDHILDFRQVKEPADIYSTAATLYYLLTGKYPFLDFDPSMADAYIKILEHPSVPLTAHRPDAPSELAAILERALRKKPRERWRDAYEMADALRELVRAETPS